MIDLKLLIGDNKILDLVFVKDKLIIPISKELVKKLVDEINTNLEAN